MAENTTLISVNTAGVVGIAAAATALKGLGKVLTSISQGVKEAFTVRGYRDYLQTVSRFGKNLSTQLLVLQMAFGRLKVAIAKAFAPLLEVVVPYINQAIFAIIRFAGVVRQFLTCLFAGVRGNADLSASAKDAAKAEDELAKAATSAGKAAKRSLMGLDQLERLNDSTGGSGGSDLSFGDYDDSVSLEVMRDVNRLLKLLEPLLAINLAPLQTALQGLRESLGGIADVLGGAFRWLWLEVLTPFIAWLAEDFAPAVTNNFAAALDLVSAAIEPVILGMQSLWQALQPIVSFIGETVVLVLQDWQKAFQDLTAVFLEEGPQITGVFQHIGQIITAAWGVIEPVLSALREHVSDCFGSVQTAVDAAVRVVIQLLNGLTGFLAGVFTGDWQQAWEGIKTFMKGLINGIIGLLNAMVQRMVTSLNSVIKAANKLSFKVPDWVPGIGGEDFGFNIKTVSAPQIPYLAQGAVLPANKPFLAMVGDQRHGTNVEAPLATIQEAVSSVMEDQTSAILAGFEASVGVQKEILEAVLGICISDEVIGNAAARYSRKQAVLRGGVL